MVIFNSYVKLPEGNILWYIMVNDIIIYCNIKPGFIFIHQQKSYGPWYHPFSWRCFFLDSGTPRYIPGDPPFQRYAAALRTEQRLSFSMAHCIEIDSIFPAKKTHSNLKISSFLWDFPWRTVNVISRWSTVDASWIHDIRNMPCAPRHWWCHLEHLTLSTTTESFACRGLQGLRRGEQNGERSNKTWTCQWFFSGDKYMF